MTTLSGLSGSLRPFLYSFSVYSCHIFLISSASVRSLPFALALEWFLFFPLNTNIFVDLEIDQEWLQSEAPGNGKVSEMGYLVI